MGSKDREVEPKLDWIWEVRKEEESGSLFSLQVILSVPMNITANLMITPKLVSPAQISVN